MNILLTGVRAPVALDWAFRLHKLGATVFMADSLRHPIGCFSPYCAGYTQTPAPAQHTAAYIGAIANLARNQHIDCIIPCCEEVMFLACNRVLLPADCQLYAPECSTLRHLHDKWQFIQSLQKYPVHPPRTVLLEDAKALSNWKATKDPENYIYKPVFGRFGSGFVPQGQKMPSNLRFPLLAQEYLSGEEVCSYALTHCGKVLACSLYSPKYRAGPGAGVYFEPRHHEGVFNFVRSYVAANKLSGQIAFDLFIDGESVSPIECNPRATSGLHLLPPDLDVLACLQGTAQALCDEPLPHTLQPRMLPFGMVLYSWQHVHQYGLRTFIRDVARARHVLDHCGKQPGPAAQCAAFAELLGLSLRHGVGLREASTRDIAWNQHDKAQ